ncbi:hypothetical protein MUN82_06350 [Hymenobacter aerilatus]|uniref:Uncharacterized protein n=1 Tax=Hymenobacter aerilatus TaxID=2932251 RepID=A0A8T9SXX5_9BACT|nr:helix-turn-helix transcriptional regulator [Hymenobacter aerilatus]UOR06715.1 hypothetical protein MUN82_06350 [Hymenobacter aerilatus]
MTESAENSINQRIKFLIEEALNSNTHKISKLLGVSDGTLRNYVSGKAKPSADFLTLMVERIDGLNATWLLTGKDNALSKSVSISGDKSNAYQNNSGPIVNSNSGDATVTVHNIDDCRRELEASQKQVELLMGQLAGKDAIIEAKDALIAAKDEVLMLLRGGHNRPN